MVLCRPLPPSSDHRLTISRHRASLSEFCANPASQLSLDTLLSIRYAGNGRRFARERGEEKSFSANEA